MSATPTSLLRVATVLALAAAAWQALLLRRAARCGRALALASRPFETCPAVTRARVLVLGDSTAVGVGAECAAHSLAGLLARRFAQVEVINRACNGARVADLLSQLDELQGRQPHFDLVLLLAGGNDVLRLSAHKRLRQDTRTLLHRLRQMAGKVVWLGCADIGRSPVFVPPLSWFLSLRTRNTMRLLADEAAACGVEFIDFAADSRAAKAARQHAAFDAAAPPAPPAPLGPASLPFALDGVHPSSASYRACFSVLMQRLPLRKLLAVGPGVVIKAPRGAAV